MDEQDWLNCADPEVLREQVKDRVSDRKLRLFAVACCRRVWPLLIDPRSRAAVEAAERYADGLCLHQELRAAQDAAERAKGADGGRAAWAAWNAANPEADEGSRRHCLGYWAAHWAAGASGPRQADERAAQAALFRDLVGNPWRPAAVAPAVLAWDGGVVGRIARLIYEEGRFDELPVLGDALEEARCTDAAVLSHCRWGGEHVRGCWVLDLLLGNV